MHNYWHTFTAIYQRFKNKIFSSTCVYNVECTRFFVSVSSGSVRRMLQIINKFNRAMKWKNELYPTDRVKFSLNKLVLFHSSKILCVHWFLLQSVLEFNGNAHDWEESILTFSKISSSLCLYLPNAILIQTHQQNLQNLKLAFGLEHINSLWIF